MHDRTSLLEARVKQQAAVAELGRLALMQTDIDVLMHEAVMLVSETLDVELAKVLELMPDGNSLLLRAGVGWDKGLVGRGMVGAGSDSQAGYTIASNAPVIVEDLRTETRFNGPELLIDHGVVSGMSVIIRGRDRAFGVLGVHTRSKRKFTYDDIYFLRSVANTLALTIERTRVDEELHRRHEEFRALGENAPDIIARFDRSYRHLFINRAIERYAGIPAAEIIGKSNQELGFDPEAVAEWEAAMQQVFETSQEIWIEFSFEGPNGRSWFQGRLAPEFARDGSVESILAVTRDITSQKETTVELQASEERFRSLSTSSPIGIVVADARGDVTYVNPRCEEITGVSAESALGRRWLKIIHAKDRATFLHTLERELATKHEAEAEIRIDSPDSRESWIKVRASPMFGPDAEISGYVATVEDITEQKEHEQRLSFLADTGTFLSQSLDVHETMNRIVDLAVPQFADMSLVNLLSETGEVEIVSVSHVDPELEARLERHYRDQPPHYEPPHTIALALESGEPVLLPEIDEDRWSRIASSTEHRELIFALEPRSLIVVPLKARGVTIGVISFLYSTSGRRYSSQDLALAMDLSERAALAIDNARLYQDAQRAIGVRDEFLSIASHELKTPLTSVKGYAQILEKASQPARHSPERVGRVAQRVREQAERLEALINDLLDVSRIQQGRLDLRLSTFDIVELAGDILERFQEGIEVTPAHSLKLSTSEPLVGTWDMERIDQVITNLISNALKYSPEGGRVEISITRDDGQCLLTVSDQGIGIPTADQRELFQPFKRTSRNPVNVTGTGLGLYIVKRIVEHHDGDIEVESTVGVGSRFTVRLPLHARPVPVAELERDPESSTIEHG